jgi:N-acetylneuraminic acid mutarotase
LPTHAVLVAGGRDDGSAELYHVQGARWATTGRLRVPRIAFTATLLRNGKVLVAGGAAPDSYQTIEGIASAELYDPARGTWTLTGSMATRRWDHTATLLPGGRVLVAGGEDECDQKGGTCTGMSDAELYDPRTGTWSTTGSMITGRHLHTATLLSTGQVLVAGGYGNDAAAPLRSAELYDPRRGTWRATGSMQTAFARASATLLPSGQVLVVGTPWSSNNPFDAELYDPHTGRWIAGSVLMKRYGLTATLLPDGKVLVAGGSTASAELYTHSAPRPASRTGRSSRG